MPNGIDFMAFGNNKNGYIESAKLNNRFVYNPFRYTINFYDKNKTQLSSFSIPKDNYILDRLIPTTDNNKWTYNNNTYTREQVGNIRVNNNMTFNQYFIPPLELISNYRMIIPSNTPSFLTIDTGDIDRINTNDEINKTLFSDFTIKNTGRSTSVNIKVKPYCSISNTTQTINNVSEADMKVLFPYTGLNTKIPLLSIDKDENGSTTAISFIDISKVNDTSIRLTINTNERTFTVAPNLKKFDLLFTVSPTSETIRKYLTTNFYYGFSSVIVEYED